MGVLKDLTNEYSGNTVREEDVIFRYEIDHENPPKHILAPEEVAFLQGLARYKLILDKSLFFQIEALQRHTKLVLSGRRAEHSLFPDQVGRDVDESGSGNYNNHWRLKTLSGIRSQRLSL